MEENTNSIPKQIAMHACIHNIKNISSTKTERERERERAICLIIPFLSFLFPFSFFLHSPRLPRHPWRHVSGLHHVARGAAHVDLTWPPTWPAWHTHTPGDVIQTARSPRGSTALPRQQPIQFPLSLSLSSILAKIKFKKRSGFFIFYLGNFKT